MTNHQKPIISLDHCQKSCYLYKKPIISLDHCQKSCYFYNKPIISINEKIRVGGLVKEGSVRKKGKNIIFVITDLKNEVIVSFVGLVPNLFAEGKGVVAEGKLRDKKYFIADKILAKHDENYMPPEVNEALNKTN